ncbi:hypothetical protein REJ26_003437 [Providencia stuartii]|uniref:SGNH/GDSL hydrolase family protein n=1 Tax=Providencia sp. 2023EL-00965 TaxID=3084975 RepID=UPI0027E9AB9B|nr:SGNH/GDSL hydrolase family protein [Providencia sp. 2023EL-00965]ELR5301660.1 hypothetical protein [Providencia stuartii]MDW7590152.1 SGNH/GDSL hydrolase family protein [Providencia sp. 2023EL-00965]
MGSHTSVTTQTPSICTTSHSTSSPKNTTTTNLGFTRITQCKNNYSSTHFSKHNQSDQVDGSLFGRHTETRISGKQFQLTRMYADKLHKTAKKPITYFDCVTVIGDSLSDSKGRMYKKSGGLLTRANPYYDGRFTNGSTWSEFLTNPSAMRSSQYSEGRATQPQIELINKAEGGSPSASYFKRTFNPTFAILSNMEKQVKNLTFTEKNLGIVFLGANDYMTYSKTDIDFIVADQKKNIEKMIKNGARNIVVMGIPDLSLTPAAKKLTTEKKEYLQKISTEHNKKTQEIVDLLSVQQLCRIQFFDVSKVFNEVMSTVEGINKDKPGSYEVDKPFSDGYIRRDNKNPLEIDQHYLFIDDVHPSQEVHMIIAMELHQFIADKFKPLT